MVSVKNGVSILAQCRVPNRAGIGIQQAPSAEPQRDAAMSDQLPRTTSRELQFENGIAIGISNRWFKGQYCSILTKAGIVGCGIYDLETPTEFGQAIAIAKGTPENPLVEPEDLFDARIVACTPKAQSFGIEAGMTGREAVELMLKAEPALN